ncbi:hypothetical protein HY024_00975 [Candidatus Curtissbacteria bacterium]|nr:hypothetical protein [Candidatus Curtissbacteria bacterium]
MAKHLAIYTQGAIKEIFSGKLKIDGRFSKIKIPPFLMVAADDIVLMKLSGEKIVGQFVVDRVMYFDHPRVEELDFITKKYKGEMQLASNFWLTHEKVNFISLIFIREVSKFLVAPEVPKKDLRPWVVLE